MALTRQVITSLTSDGTDILGTKVLAVKIADESIVSGSLLTVESNHFCVLKSRGAVLNVYETGQYALTTPDKPLLGSIATGFFGGNSPWVYEVIYINRSKLLVRSEGVATSEEMAEMAYQVDYYIHVDTKEAALDLITHLPFNGHIIDTKEVADYAGPAIEQSINQIVQVTKMEDINEHIQEVRELVKNHLAEFLRTYGITLNDLKVLIMPKDERMRELIS
ncbi:MAG TPA: SPFH domain-containing protein, partial [Terracidiphilus sp.]|nr:SPFH domain-containing protein [Terracidiphilus sp.]